MRHVVTTNNTRTVGKPLGVFFIYRLQQQHRRIDRTRRYYNNIATECFSLTVPFGDHTRHRAARRVGFQFRHFCIGHERDVRMFQRGIDAHNVGVRFGVDQTREAIAGLTADARTLVAQGFVEANTHRQMERLKTTLL